MRYVPRRAMASHLRQPVGRGRLRLDGRPWRMLVSSVMCVVYGCGVNVSSLFFTAKATIEAVKVDEARH